MDGRSEDHLGGDRKTTPPRPHRGPVPQGVLTHIEEIVGTTGVIRDPAEIAPYCVSWRDDWKGQVPMVVRPASAEDVAAVVKVCAEAGVPIVPQGGNTGLTGASQPHDDNSEILLSLSRMNRIRDLDTDNDTITVEAGCILQAIQQAADAADRLFPLSLAAEGSCQIGGNLATNAGGTQVLRYGNMRTRVLGLEVVLPDGAIWDGLRALRKDNTGYDLKQLFIGAEGTLGIITAAVLTLVPKPTDVQAAVMAVPSPAAAVALLGQCRRALGELVQGFELIHRLGLDMTLRHIPGIVDPFEEAHDWYVLMEVAGQSAPGTLRDQVESILASALEDGLVTDAVVAQNDQQRTDFWRIRESIPEAQNHDGASIKHDVSVPVSRVPSFLDEATSAITKTYPGARPLAFGHVGDGNIHFNIAQPMDWDGSAFKAERPAVNRIVHDIVARYGGSISAEHGLGRLRREEVVRYKPAVELDLMRRIKTALDPHDIMNPGKVVP